jgi:hypothetical protein
MSEPIITKQMLIDADACSDQVDLFEKTFGDSVTVTIKRAEKVANLFDWDWATWFLDAPASAKYKRVQAPAWAECQRVNATARTEYQRVNALALDEYQRVTAIAWASAFINIHNRGASK